MPRLPRLPRLVRVTHINPMNPERRMKNIYNLITDAFESLDDTQEIYNVQVHKFQNSYQITITRTGKPTTEMAFLNLTIGSRNNLLEINDINTLFTDVKWDRFCKVFELQG
jgi:hypothetical protein